MSDDLLVGGASFSALTGVTVPSWNALLPIDAFRGDNKTVPGIPGASGVDLVRDWYDLDPILFHIKGTSRTNLLTNIAAVQALFPTTLVTLTRVSDTATCAGQYLGMRPVAGIEHETDVDYNLYLRNLDGEWS